MASTIGMALSDIQFHQRQQRLWIVRGESRRTLIRRAGFVQLSLRLTQPSFCHDGDSTVFRSSTEALQRTFRFNPVFCHEINHHQHVERGQIIRPLLQQVVESSTGFLVTTTLAFQRCKRSSGIDLPGIERHCVFEAFLRKIVLSGQQIGLAEQELHRRQLRLVV